MRLFILILLLNTASVYAADLSIDLSTNENISGVANNTILPLVADVQTNKAQAIKKSFQGNAVEGWLQQNGDWFIKGTVTHSRLRCATYQLGVQLGKGNPSCLNVEWISEIQYGTMQQQCNSAPVQHTGGGSMPELQNLLEQATCVQVVVKCTGTCDQ